MEKDFVPYDRAFRMKALGFDEPCFAYYVKYNDDNRLPKLSFNLPNYLKSNSHLKYLETLPSGKGLFIGINEGGCAVPTFSQAFIWFDENTEWSGFIVPSKKEGFFDWWIQNYTDPNYLTVESDECYVSRKEAELACLDKLLEIVESKSE